MLFQIVRDCKLGQKRDAWSGLHEQGPCKDVNWTLCECIPVGVQGEVLFFGRLNADQPKKEYVVDADGKALLEEKLQIRCVAEDMPHQAHKFSVLVVRWSRGSGVEVLHKK